MMLSTHIQYARKNRFPVTADGRVPADLSLIGVRVIQIASRLGGNLAY